MINNDRLIIQAINDKDTFNIKSSKQLNSEQQDIVSKIAQSISKNDKDSTNIEEIDFNFDKDLSIKIIKKDRSIQDYSIEKETNKDVINLINRLSVSVLNKMEATVKPLDSSRTHFPASNSLSLNMFQAIIRSLVRYFFYETSIKAVIDQKVKNLTLGKSASDLKTTYIQSYKKIQEIKKEIVESTPNYKFYFDEEEVDTLILAHLGEQVNTRLKELKEPVWDKKILDQLNTSRLIHDLKENVDGSHKKIIAKLYRVPILDIPIDELKTIPITSQNKTELAQFWKYLTANLFQQGRLDQLTSQASDEGFLSQTNYAVKYLNTFIAIPKELQDVQLNEGSEASLGDFCQELEQKQKNDSIRDFIISQSLLGALEITTEDPHLQEKQQVFQRYLRPLLKGIRNDLENLSITQIANHVVFLERQGIAEFLKQAKRALPANKQGVFSEANLKELITNEYERILNVKGKMTVSQMGRLRKLRIESENRLGEIKKFTQKAEVIANKLAIIRPLQEQLDGLNETAQAVFSTPDAKLALNLLTNPEVKVAYLRAINKQLESDGILLEHKELLQGILDTKPEAAQLEKIFHSLTSLIEIVPFRSGAVELAVRFKDSPPESMVLLKKLGEDVKNKSQQVVDLSKKRWESFNEDLIIIQRSADNYKRRANALEDQIQRQTLEINEDWISKNFDINHPDLVQNLLVATESVRHKDDDSLVRLIWKKALEKKFNDLTTDELVGNAEITPDLKIRLDKYLELKSLLSGIKLRKIWNNERCSQVKSFMDELEKKITNEKIKTYIQQPQATYRSLDIEEALFGNDELRAVETSQSSYSTFLPSQQANLMFLTKILTKTEAGQVLTVEEKDKFKNLLGEVQKDKNLMKQVKLMQDGLPGVDIFLQYIPGFLQGFAKRFILRPEDTKPVIVAQLMGGVSQSAIDFLEAFFYATKNIPNLDKIKKLNEKAKKLLEKYNQDPASIKPKDRLTLKEIGVLGRFGLINREGVIDQLTNLGAIEDRNEPNKLEQSKSPTALSKNIGRGALDLVNSSLVDLKSVFKETEAIIKDIDNIVLPAAAKHYQDGGILAYVGSKKTAWTGKPLELEDYLATFLTGDFTHAAKLYHNEQGELYRSEVWNDFRQMKMNLYNLCISDIWDINIIPLVDPSMHDALQAVYGDRWQDKVNGMYREIEKRMHVKLPKRSLKAENNQEQRIAAGLASHPWLFGKLSGQQNLRGHEGNYNVDFNEMRKKFLGYEGSNQNLEDAYDDEEVCSLGENQICSEFASRTTATAMVELNERLSRDILAHFQKLNQSKNGPSILAELTNKKISLPNEVKKYLQGVRYTKKKAKETQDAEQVLIKILKSEGYSKEDINLIIRLNNKEIFDLPYNKKERFEAIHPGRMVKLLLDKKCAVKREHPKEMTALINF